jgi:hypothetical protein
VSRQQWMYFASMAKRFQTRLDKSKSNVIFRVLHFAGQCKYMGQLLAWTLRCDMVVQHSRLRDFACYQISFALHSYMRLANVGFFRIFQINSCNSAYPIERDVYVMKTWGNEGIASSFLTSALDGVERSASRFCRFTPGERIPGTHWIGGWVGPSVGLNAVEWRKIYCSCRESNPWPSIP